MKIVGMAYKDIALSIVSACWINSHNEIEAFHGMILPPRGMP